MNATASFAIQVEADAALRFADWSGDWNPLHTNPEYAATTSYGRPVLHGAFSAGLVSRMAGMHLPGTECLLHGMRLRFVTPILPPAQLTISGRIVSDDGELGSVSVTITDSVSGVLYTEASYEFSRHASAPRSTSDSEANASAAIPSQGLILLTGASGGVGQALSALYGDRVRPIRRAADGSLQPPADLPVGSVAALVHCGWPGRDNMALTRLNDPIAAVSHHVAQPLQQMIESARMLNTFGRDNALLLLLGSTASRAGRHAWRTPLYSLAKGMVPTLAEILAVELAPQKKRCVGVIFDALDGGMNSGQTPRIRQMNADRSPWQTLASLDEAARQIAWVLDNPSPFVSGATITLSGGALP